MMTMTHMHIARMHIYLYVRSQRTLVYMRNLFLLLLLNVEKLAKLIMNSDPDPDQS